MGLLQSSFDLIDNTRSVAMQPSKNKIALVTGALILGASSAANAVNESFNITATALPDVAITTVTPMNFNTSIFIDAGGTCLMNASVPGDVAANGMQYSNDGTTSSANYGDLSGDGCVNNTNGDATPGVYRIRGLEGAEVKVTISNSALGGDVTFSPNSGCIVTYGGSTAIDTCASFVPGSLTTKNLAGSVEDNSAAVIAGGDASVAGDLLFTVGGTLSIINELVPNFAGTIAFDVQVTY
jgi:hypothetical protein